MRYQYFKITQLLHKIKIKNTTHIKVCYNMYAFLKFIRYTWTLEFYQGLKLWTLIWYAASVQPPLNGKFTIRNEVEISENCKFDGQILTNKKTKYVDSVPKRLYYYVHYAKRWR
jgi:hypothetical protein